MKNIPMDRVPLSENEYASSMLQAGDLLFARQSLVLEGAGQCSILMDDDEEICFESHLIRCRLNKTIANPLFFYYFFSSPLGKQAIYSIVEQGAGAAGIRGSDLAKVLVPDVDIDTQKDIAYIFDQLDAKIELNRQINQTLEHIAQAIFKSWFVDFEPTRAKIAAKQHWQAVHGVVETSSPTCYSKTGDTAKPNTLNLDDAMSQAAMAAISGLSRTDAAGAPLEELQQLSPEQLQHLQNIAALFPDALVDSELGEIPEGWGVKTLDEVTSTILDHRGKTPKKLGGDWVDKGYPAISAKNIKNGRLVRHDTIRFLNEDLYAKWMRVEIDKGDILLTSEAPMGEMYFITDATKYCLSQRLYALRADNKNVTPSFLYLWLQTASAQADLENRATGTTVVGIRQVELRKVNALVTPLELLNIFEKAVFPLYEKLSVNELESQELAGLRDELLPKLLSGEIEARRLG
tara:strand:- start:2337 stop:3722 length:1386 start_codon:yes stop_codon:yes gene_type:complete